MCVQVIDIGSIESLIADGDKEIQIRKIGEDSYFGYTVENGCANDVIKQLLYHILFNIVENHKEKSNPLNKISNTLEKFVENVGVSIGSDEYNQAKSHFENNIK